MDDEFDIERMLRDIDKNPDYNEGKVKKKKSTPKIEIKGLDVPRIPSKSIQFEQRPFMKTKIIPDMCSSVLFVGGTSSGKTTALISMFLNSDMYKGYFDEVYLFSATGACDSLFDYLGLKEERIITHDMVNQLNKLVKKLKKRAEDQGTENAPKTAIIFEDLTANKKLMSDHNMPFIECFVQNRHLATMTFACVHKWKGLTRTARLQCSNIIYFPAPVDDMKVFMEDTQPPNLTKNEYLNVIQFAHEPTQDMPRPFLHINRKVDFDKQFRKGFKNLINLNEFKKRNP